MQFMKELEYKPMAAHRMDDSSPYQDYSGYGRTATGPTESRGIALTSVAGYSQKVAEFPDKYAAFTTPGMFKPGNERQEFSFTLSTYSVSNYCVFSANNEVALLIVYNDRIHLELRWTDNTTTSIDFMYETNRKFHIAVVYNGSNVSLYVNGELAGSEKVDETKTFKTGGDGFYAATAANDQMLLNNVCFYFHALSPDAVKAIYDYNSRHVVERVPVSFGGALIDVSAQTRKPSMKVRWDTDDEWNAGVHQQTTTENDQLVAQMQNEVTMEGLWSNSITFAGPIVLDNFQSAYLAWQGENVTIEASVNGTDWTVPVKGKNLAMISNGFDPNGKTLFLRANFPAGEEDAYLDYIELRAFNSTTAPNHIDERTITYTNPAQAWDLHDPNELNDFSGVRLDGGTIQVSADASIDLKTLEVWIKPDAPLVISPSSNLQSPTNFYVNGVQGGAVIPGQWQIIHYTFNTAVTGPFSFTGNAIIGQFAVYPRVLTQAEITKVINAYTGYPITRVSDDSAIAISEPATPAKIYDHAWANRTTNA